MKLISKMTIPTLVGGLFALAATGLFMPQVRASWTPSEVIAQVSGVAADRVLNIRSQPSVEADRTGTIARNAFVWVEACDGIVGQEGWCLIERGGTRGWADARYLSLAAD